MGIQSTLHGYRVQFLYTLYRMMFSENTQEVFVPEGKEDLDVYNDGVLEECIQVKCHSEVLTYKDLFSAGKKTSLFSRAVESLDENPDVKVKVVSINGKISDELTNKTRLKRKLKGDSELHLKEPDAKRLANIIDAAVYDEQEMLSSIASELKSRFVEINTGLGIRLLTQWIYEAAEHGEHLTVKDLEQEIRAIDVFQSQIRAFQQQLGYAIVPLFMENNLIDCDEQALSYAYYDGVSARPEHILAGLDVERVEITNDVETAFRQRNTVIVHGLSGAGKSTFAYRYIYEHSSAMAYEIRNCNPKNVNDVLAALSAIANGLRIPTMFYFDVSPSNPEWIEAISILADRKDVRCLVTMRQEDWNIQYPRISSIFKFEDVTLELHRKEAEQIFNKLAEKDVVVQRSFEVAWEEVGQSGDLLEFVYSLTHGETLENRIKSQIYSEPEQNKIILGYIGTANYLGGGIGLDDLLQLSGLSKVVVSTLVDKLQHEFFRMEGGVMKDVHPIRTKFIVKALFGNTPLFLKETAMEIFYKAEILDGHLYILRMMKECGLTIEELVSDFSHKELSPIQAYSIARALLWCGIYDYERKHKELISELSSQIGPLWEFFLPVNFTDIDISKSLSVFREINPEFPDISGALSRFCDQQEVLCHLEKWLNVGKFNFHPANHKEWYFVSKFLTLVSWVNSKDIEVLGIPDSQSIASESLGECAQILLGLKSVGRFDLVSDYERQFIIRLRLENNIIQFKKERQSIRMLSFLDYNEEASERTETNKGYITEQVNLHIIDLCRCAFPEMEEYHSEILKDDLIKLFKDIPNLNKIKRDKLPLEEMREPRTVLCNLYKKEKGIANRELYANVVLQKRKDYIKANTLVTRFLDEWHKNPQKASKEYKHMVKGLMELADKTDFSIPSSEISEFGYGRSSDMFFDKDQDLKNKELDDVYYSVDKYFSGLRTFYYQFPKAIVNEGNFKNTASVHLFDTTMFLPSFQSDFRKVFGKYISENELDLIDEQEDSSIKRLWIVWESLREGVGYNNVSYLLQRYKQMNVTLIGKLVEAIEKGWKDCGFDRERLRINVNHKAIMIDFIYSNEEDYYYGLSCIQTSIAQKLSNYNYYSSQRMIIQNAMDKVTIKPLCQLSDGTIASLDGQHLVCTTESLFSKADDVVKQGASYFFVPEQNVHENTFEELKVFNLLLAVMNLMVWTCNHLSSINGQCEEDDIIANEIFENYRHLCEKRMTETNLDIFDSLSTLRLKDASVKSIIDNAIMVIKSFMSSIVSNPTWFMYSEQLKSACGQLNEIKMYIQLQILDCAN